MKFSRRAVLFAAGLALSLSPLRSVLAADDADATLNRFLRVLLRRLFPHAAIPESLYAAVASGVEAAIRADPSLLSRVQTGRRDLDQLAQGDWLTLETDAQIAALAKTETTPFFQSLRQLAGFAFYNEPRVWPYLGYEGSSFEKGGYLRRGFDDLDWLPEPKA